MLQHSAIYHGPFGSSFFQMLYSPGPAMPLMLCTALEFHALIVVPLIALSLAFPFAWSLTIASMLIPLAVCATAAFQAER